MARWLRTLFALPVLCGAPAQSAPLTRDELGALRDLQKCAEEGGRVVFAGNSTQLGACLERLGKSGEPIDELQVTSPGGEAWETLQIARGLHGRLDLIVVEGLCASSCANYLLPAARRLRVEPHSYVLLHGSMSQRDASGQHEDIRQQVREVARTQPWGKDMSAADVEKMAQQSIDAYHADLEAHIPVQEAFARDRLSCDDWLDVWAHFGGQKPPAGMAWLLVTPEMAARCLRTTKPESFWPPETQGTFDPGLGLFRALK